MTVEYKVVEAAAFVTRETGAGELLYRDAPVPSDAANLQELIEGGFIEKIDAGEGFSGHPSDLPDGFVPPVFAGGSEAGTADSSAFPVDGSEEDQESWVADGSVASVTAYASEHPDEAAAILAAEERRSTPRTTLVDALTKLTEGS